MTEIIKSLDMVTLQLSVVPGEGGSKELSLEMFFYIFRITLYRSK